MKIKPYCYHLWTNNRTIQNQVSPNLDDTSRPLPIIASPYKKSPRPTPGPTAGSVPYLPPCPCGLRYMVITYCASSELPPSGFGSMKTAHHSRLTDWICGIFRAKTAISRPVPSIAVCRRRSLGLEAIYDRTGKCFT